LTLISTTNSFTDDPYDYLASVFDRLYRKTLGAFKDKALSRRAALPGCLDYSVDNLLSMSFPSLLEHINIGTARAALGIT
jgi:hypothetical protein